MSNDSKIIPTVGRVVWYHPAPQSGESNFAEHYQPGAPYAAIVAYVGSAGLVNLSVFDANGTPHGRTSVALIQEGEAAPRESAYCEWMPFQKGQAKAQSARQASAATQVPLIVPAADEVARAAGLVPFGFGMALDCLKKGLRVAREGWNGKGMFVYHVPAASYPVQTGAAKDHFGDGAMVPYNAYLAIKTTAGAVSTWVPSVNDCLAEDWMVVE